MILVTRKGAEYAARVVTFLMIYSCTSLRDSLIEPALGKAFGTGALMKLRSVRRAAHGPADTCILHGSEVCLSSREVTWPALFMKRQGGTLLFRAHRGTLANSAEDRAPAFVFADRHAAFDADSHSGDGSIASPLKQLFQQTHVPSTTPLVPSILRAMQPWARNMLPRWPSTLIRINKRRSSKEWESSTNSFRVTEGIAGDAEGAQWKKETAV